MESFLPSEIARLVLGYLDAEGYPEAARVFLATSPHLQECRDVAARGRKFSTKVNGLTLTKMLEQYASMYGLIQEKVNKLDSDSEYIKQNRDVVEQMRVLIDHEAPEQRLFVNTNNPPQTYQTAGGSPIISSSMKKHRHSGSETKDKNKRLDKDTEYKTNDELLPKHTAEYSKPSLFDVHSQLLDFPVSSRSEQSPILPSSTVTESRTVATESCDKLFNDAKQIFSEPLVINTHDTEPKSSSTGTDTQELMKYSTAEVQTAPLDIGEINLEHADEPIENLSIWTREILNRKEMLETIAENINKGITSTDVSIKEMSFSEAMGADNAAVGECNTSITTELNIAMIKNIVNVTERDPRFEELLHEIVGPNEQMETSPDEDAQRDPTVSNNLLSMQPFKVPAQPSSMPPLIDKSSNPSLKSIVSNNINDDGFSALDDFNAAAIQGIINVNHQATDKQDNSENTEPTSSSQYNYPSAEECLNEKKPKQSPLKPKLIKSKRKTNKPVIRSIEAVSVPKLIVCTKAEMMEMQYHKPTKERPADQKFIPIAPKNYLPIAPEPMFLRTVTVPTANGETITQTVISSEPELKKTPMKLPNLITINQAVKTNINIDQKYHQGAENLPAIAEEPCNKVNESITLYCGESSSGGVLPQASVPIIDLDDSIAYSGTGLSPFLKFHQAPVPPLIDIVKKCESDKKLSTDDIVSTSVKMVDCDFMTKRTPKSLRKSREVNHRLSLSTPRRRNSHIRALDFNTPSKSYITHRRLSDAGTNHRNSLTPTKTTKSACRTSLFNSPPFGSVPTKERKGLKVIRRASDPKSPTPKLSGEWDKFCGVGTILGSTSPQVNCNDEIAVESTQSNATKKSWDADLRDKLNIELEEPKVSAKSKKKSLKLKIEEKIDNKIVPDDVNDNKTETVSPQANNSESIEAKSISTVAQTVSMVVDKGITKKYVKLKTLTKSVTKTKIHKSEESLLNSSIGINDKSTGSAKGYLKNLPDLMALVTPRKIDLSMGIPPTPRIMSPSSNLATPYVRTGDDSSKIQSFIPTPEFPTTPGINLTPKQISENTADAKAQYSASYYQPSSELKDNKPTKTQIETTKQLEITQFEVIKENLSEAEARKELIISRNAKEMNQSEEKNIVEKSLDSTGTTINDSSDSETSSSSGCSSSCSCSSPDDSDNTSKVSIERRHKQIPKITEAVMSSNSISIAKEQLMEHIFGSSHEDDDSPAPSKTQPKTLDNINSQATIANKILSPITKSSDENRQMNESSPQKVFTIEKTAEELEDVDLETPAKNDALLAEANISETPCGSKNGIETLTNLTSKISALQDQPHNSEIPWRLHKLDEGQNKKTTREYLDQLMSPKDSNKALETKNNIDSPDKEIVSPGNAAKSNTRNVMSLRKSPRNVAPKITEGRRRSLSKRSKKIALACKNMFGDDTLSPAKSTDSRSSKRLQKIDEEESVKHVIDKKTDEIREKTPERLASTVNKITKVTENTTELNNEIHNVSEETKQESESASIDKDANNPGTTANTDPLEINEKEISVLESLELIPTVKSSASDNNNTSFESSDSRYAYLFCVHDYNIPKKRRPKYKIPEIGYILSLAGSDDEDKLIRLEASAYIEPFTITSKLTNTRPRRGKSEAKTVTSQGIKVEKNKLMTPSVNSQPLATSSPVIEESLSLPEHPKPLPIKPETEKSQITTRKRKNISEAAHAAPKDVEPITKKKTVSDPKTLLCHVNIEDFLTSVHGPITKS